MSAAPDWKEWVVGGALIESDGGFLLVQNLRRGGRLDWSPPGGVIDDGEELLSGLTVTEWAGPIYEIETHAPGLGWHLRVEVWAAVAFEGALCCEDPDGIVVDVRFVPLDELLELVQGNHPWVVEPLCEYLDQRWDGSRSFGYHVEGDRLPDLVVTRR